MLYSACPHCSKLKLAVRLLSLKDCLYRFDVVWIVCNAVVSLPVKGDKCVTCFHLVFQFQGRTIINYFVSVAVENNNSHFAAFQILVCLKPVLQKKGWNNWISVAHHVSQAVIWSLQNEQFWLISCRKVCC